VVDAAQSQPFLFAATLNFNPQTQSRI